MEFIILISFIIGLVIGILIRSATDIKPDTTYEEMQGFIALSQENFELHERVNGLQLETLEIARELRKYIKDDETIHEILRQVSRNAYQRNTLKGATK